MITEKIAATVSRHKMLTPNQRVLVALSGGADSTALLLSLRELGYGVYALHVNHNLRGGESLRDQHFCEDLCQRLNIPLTVKSVDVKSYCEKNKVSIELGARRLRYKALFEAAGGDPVATAHTLSDCLETALFNLTRGCGIKGICGIPPVRGQVIRPLIDCTREEIEEYLSLKGQGYVTDSTNLLPDCSRNIIRLNVIPELKKINPGLMSSFAGTVNSLREAEGYIAESAADILKNRRIPSGYDLSGVSDSAVLSAALGEFMKEAGIEPSYERIAALKGLLAEDGVINISKGVYVRSHGGRLTVERPEKAPEPARFTLRENAEAMGKIICVTKISPFDISRFNKSELRYFFDESKMAESFILRPYSGSERIKLPGREHSSVIKKLIADVPAGQRKRIIVADDGSGAVFVEGKGVSERVACSESTRSAIKVDITDKNL